MRRPIQALTWEYFRESGWLMLAVIAVIAVAPLAFGQAIGLFGADALNTPEQPLKLYINYLGIAAFGFLLPHAHSQTTMAKRHCGLPVSTVTLASLGFVIAVVVAMLSNVATQFAYSMLAGIQWPVLTTTVTVGAFVALVIAGAWWVRDFRAYKPCVMIAVLVAWIYWILRHIFPTDMTGPAHRWEILSAVDVVGFTTTFAVSWLLTIRSFSAFRCGEANPGWLSTDYFSPQTAILEADNRDHSIEKISVTGPGEALSIMNTRNSLMWVAGSAAMMSVGLWLISWFVMRGKANPVKGLTAMWTMFSVMVGFMAGQDIWMKKSVGMRPFLATLPISDREFALVTLRNKAKMATMSWAILLTAAVVLLFVFIGLRGTGQIVSYLDNLPLSATLGRWSAVWLLVQSLLLCWIAAGTIAAMSLSGNLVLMVGMLFAIEMGVAAILFFNGLASDGVDWADGLAEVTAIAMSGMLGFGSTLFAFLRGRRLNLVSNFQTVAAAIFMGAFCGAIFCVLDQPFAWKVVWCFSSFSIVAPFAAIPCAIHWNRHR